MDLGPGVETTPVSLNFARSMPEHEWIELGYRLSLLGGSVVWWIGDFLAFGKFRYGEKYATALEMFGLTFNTAHDYANVSGSVRVGVRTPDLSWSHHRAVAKVPSEEQQHWLSKALENGWSVRELVDAMNAFYGDAKPPEEIPEQVAALEVFKWQVEGDRAQRWRLAAERVGLELDEWLFRLADERAAELMGVAA
jgi:ParB-like protein